LLRAELIANGYDLLTATTTAAATATATTAYETKQSQWGVEPDVYCINSLMGVHLAQGRYQRVQELYAAMQSIGVVPDMCSTNTAIAACEKLGDGAAALALLRSVLLLSITAVQPLSYTVLH
jgi:hypothetical protein